ncbi:MAG: ATP synthase F1 subunit delta [Clostridiales bacterium]|nr:ATP synthase F1 subunit delta [Clostridiales bacterium]
MASLSMRYAKALFELALKGDQLDEYLAQAVLVRDALEASEHGDVLTSLYVSDEEKRRYVKDHFARQIHVDLLGFLYLMIEKNHEATIVPALTEFIEMGNRRNRRVAAYVVSATPLTADQVAGLRELLSKKIGKPVTIFPRVDPALIGGLFVYVDGYLVDRTVRRQLTDMRDHIKRGVLG